MKASEVLKRYTEGRRDFRGLNLRGLSFKGEDLSHADFSEADIRGTNFRGATLQQTKFTAAKAGLQKRWVVVLLIICLILVVFSGVFSGFAGFLIAGLLSDSVIESKIVAYVSLISLLGYCIFIIRQGVGVNFAFTFAITFAIAFAIGFSFAFTIAIAFAFAIAIALAFAITFAVAFAIAFSFAVAFAIGFAIAIAFGEISEMGLLVGIIASSITLVLGLLSAYIGWLAIKGDEKYALIRGNAVAIAATGGTCFRDADLTDADFSKALLKNTDLRSKILIRTCWRQAKKLDLARVGNTILSEPAVKELLVTGKGQGKSFEKANLRGANLTDADLSYANLKQADLSQAMLKGANLKGAILTETNCVGTDFTQVTLTAACLKAWNTDSTTIFKKIKCRYIFLLERPDSQGSLERRPHDPKEVFQPGDFEKLYRQIMNTVEILLRNGVDPPAFQQAFQQLMKEHPEIDYNSIQSIQKKGNDILVTLEVPENTDKGQVERQFLDVYEAQLEAAKQALLEAEMRHNRDMKEITMAAILSDNSVNIDIKSESQAMSNNQNIDGDAKGNIIGSMGGNFDASGAISNIDNTNSSVSSSINELPASEESEKPGIKELLKQLKTAISNTPELSKADKAEALEKVQALAEVGQKAKESRGASQPGY